MRVSPYDEPSVRRAARALVRVLTLLEPGLLSLWREHRLTLTQARCLRLLSDGPLPAGALAQRLSLSAPSLTRILERLEARELVQRQPDEDDRRKVWVHLSPAGRDLLGALRLWQDSPLAVAVQEMPEERRLQLAQLLEELVDRAEALAAASEGEDSSPGKK